MKAMRLICPTLIVLAMGGVNSAFAESGAVTIYKQQVAKIVDTWNQTMTRFNDEIVKDNATIESLKAQNPPTRDADNKIAALRADIASAKKTRWSSRPGRRRWILELWSSSPHARTKVCRCRSSSRRSSRRREFR